MDTQYQNLSGRLGRELTASQVLTRVVPGGTCWQMRGHEASSLVHHCSAGCQRIGHSSDTSLATHTPRAQRYAIGIDIIVCRDGDCAGQGQEAVPERDHVV